MSNLAISPVGWFLLHPVFGTILFGAAWIVSWVLKRLGYQPNRRTAKWPTTPGTVSNVEMKYIAKSTNALDSYRISVSYAYNVTDRHYGFFEFETLLKEHATRTTAALQTQPVLVHYNPADELDSVLWEDELLLLAKTAHPQ